MNMSLGSLDDDGLGARLRALASGGGLGSRMGGISSPNLVDGSIVLDSFRDGLEATRSAALMEERQVVVQAGDVTVVVDIARDPSDPDRLRVSGQVIGLDLPVAVQSIDAQGQETDLVITDDLGEFVLWAADGGATLIAATATIEITIALPSLNPEADDEPTG